jgi:5-methylcytosine-specific restriction enzyme A
MQFCAEHGCGVIVARGRCAIHRRPELEQIRGSARKRGYSKRWDRRAAAFRARYPLCGMRPHGVAPIMSQCYLEHRTTIATQVDHVVPHRGDPVLMWDELGNWQSLCSACHMLKTAAGR